MTLHSLIPLMYHPTNIVLLDDDRKFLNDVSLVFKEHISYVFDDDPEKILNYLKNHTYQPDVLSGLLVKQIFDSDQSKVLETFSVDFSRLRMNLISPNRFKKCAVSLIDRRMKKMDGLDFCQTVQKQELLVKTILFTGHTSTEEAVQAFNQNIINGFLVKEGDPYLLAQKINSIIGKNTWQQFVELGKALSGLISCMLKPLSDQQFITVFEEVCQDNGIVEFYLLDSSCSFLLLNADGKAKQLFVKSEEDFKDCYEIARDAKAPDGVVQAIAHRQLFPYTEKPMNYIKFQNQAWHDAMVPMHKVPDRALFYSVIDRPDVEAYAFNQYLREGMFTH